jgi:hypothetical protein
MQEDDGAASIALIEDRLAAAVAQVPGHVTPG